MTSDILSSYKFLTRLRSTVACVRAWREFVRVDALARQEGGDKEWHSWILDFFSLALNNMFAATENNEGWGVLRRRAQGQQQQTNDRG